MLTTLLYGAAYLAFHDSRRAAVAAAICLFPLYAYGHLAWEETLGELCPNGVDERDGVVNVGDIFQITEECGADPTAMQDAFDQYGLPDEACMFVDVDGLYQPLSYCAPLSARGPAAP